MLTLPTMGKWFYMILSGEKKEEYREIKPYYTSRFKKIFEMYPYSNIPSGGDKGKSDLGTDTAAVDRNLSHYAHWI